MLVFPCNQVRITVFKHHLALKVDYFLLIKILFSPAYRYPRLISHPESAACPCGTSMSRPAIPPRCALPLPLPSLFFPLPVLEEALDLDLLVAKLEGDVRFLGR